MTDGFLIIDCKMNTVIIPNKDKELQKWVNTVSTNKIRKHQTFKELGKEVKAFLEGTYKEEKK